MLVMTQMSWAQLSRDLGDFDEVKVFDRISVELIPSTQNKITISGDRSEDVEIINNNGELKIRMRLEKLLKGEEVTAKLYFKFIESIDANEGSYVSCDAVFKQTEIELTAREGSEIRVKLDVQKVETKAVTGGKLKITGSALNQEASVAMGGILDAQQLQTSQTSITVKAGGQAEVRASELVSAKVRAGGDITVFGSPAKVSRDIKLGGSITDSPR